MEQAIHAEGLSTSTDSRALLRDQDIAVPSDWPRAPSKATVCHDTPSTRGHSPRQHEYFPLTPRFASVASISSQQPHFMRQCGMPACCTLAGGRSPSRAVGCNSPQKRAAPEPCGPGALLGTDLGQRSIVMSAEPPVLYEKSPVAMTKYGHVSHMGKCWHYPTGMIPQWPQCGSSSSLNSVTLEVFVTVRRRVNHQSDVPVGEQPCQTQRPNRALDRIIRDRIEKHAAFR